MKKIKKIITLLIVITMLLPFVPTELFANDYGEPEGSISFSMDINITNDNFSVQDVTVNGYAWANNQDQYKTNNGTYVVHGTIISNNGTRPQLRYGGNLNEYMQGRISIGPESDTEYSFNINLDGIGTTLDSENQPITFLGLDLLEEENVPGPGPGGDEGHYDSTANVNLTVTGAELENPYGEEASEIRVSINRERFNGIGLDNYVVTQSVQNEFGENRIASLHTKNPIQIGFNNTDQSTVIIGIKAQWNTYLTNVTINGVSYANQLPKNKQALIEHYTNQQLEMFFEVDKATDENNTYNIVVEGRKQNDDEIIMGNFLWNYDPNNNETSEDDKIPNAKLEFVSAKYGTEEYYSVQDLNNKGGIYHWKDAERKKVYNEGESSWGEATFPVGTELTVRLIPDQGYQLTNFGLNGNPFEPGEDACVYTFEITGGNFHLEAKFTEEGNSVVSNVSEIKNGNIEVAQNTFDYGTAKLEAKEVENLSAKRRSDFEDAAYNEGYEVENYVDLSLYNTVYKGGKKDDNGNYYSWDTPVEHLEQNAVVTLELGEDMSGKDIAVVHEKHEGDLITGYEVIDAEYNKENNTVTFETNSFSNYAIATKVAEEEKYTLTQGNITLTFTDEAGHEFVLEIIEVWNLTKEDLKEFGISEEEYAKIKETITKNVKEYGTVIFLYMIDVSDEDYVHNGKVNIKIKMTDEMKKFNTFRLININEDDYSAKDVIELEIDGDYLVGTLPHLSIYALTGEYVEVEKASSPKTGDYITTYITLFAIASLGLCITNKIKKHLK